MLEILHIRWRIFLFWWNRKNVASRAEKPCFGRKMTGNGRKWLKNMVFPLWKPYFCDFIKIKKIRSLICKISDIFCLAKYDLQWSWFFDFYLWVSKFLNLQNCIKTCFNYFFLFLSSFLALVEPFLGVSEFLSNILSFFRIA